MSVPAASDGLERTAQYTIYGQRITEHRSDDHAFLRLREIGGQLGALPVSRVPR